MIDLEFVERLIRTLDESGLDSVEIERGGTRIRVSRSPTPGASPILAATPAVPPDPGSGPPRTGGGNPTSQATEGSGGEALGAMAAGSNLSEITSPMVGTFYRSPAPDLPPFADLGTRISQGDPICIIEAMKLMNELEADVEGIIREICVANGEPVEYGQVLFRVEPA